MNFKYFYPIAIFLLCFLVDKVLYFENVLHSFVKWNRFEMSAYKTREALFELYKQDPKPKIVLLGSSKLASIQRLEIEKNFPDLSFYNFCVPLPSLSYLLYVLQKMQTLEKPSFLILELDLAMFTHKAQYYPFQYGIPWSFFIEYVSLWSKKDIELYLSKQLFLVSRYPISFSALWENHTYLSYFQVDGRLVKIRKKDLFPLTEKILLELIQENHGGIRIPYNISQTNLYFDAQEKWNELFSAEPFPNKQLPFYQTLLQNIQKASIPFFIVLSPHSPQFRKKLIQSGQEKFLNKFLVDLPKESVLDLRDFLCQSFEDSFHMQGECFPYITYEIIQKLSRQLQ